MQDYTPMLETLSNLLDTCRATTDPRTSSAPAPPNYPLIEIPQIVDGTDHEAFRCMLGGADALWRLLHTAASEVAALSARGGCSKARAIIDPSKSRSCHIKKHCKRPLPPDPQTRKLQIWKNPAVLLPGGSSTQVWWY